MAEFARATGSAPRTSAREAQSGRLGDAAHMMRERSNHAEHVEHSENERHRQFGRRQVARAGKKCCDPKEVVDEYQYRAYPAAPINPIGQGKKDRAAEEIRPSEAESNHE